MSKFKVGDRVKVIEEPIFVTMYPNNVWEMYPQEDGDSIWGRANLQHLVGEEGVITHFYPNGLDNRIGWWDVKFDKDVAVPRGLNGFNDYEIELV